MWGLGTNPEILVPTEVYRRPIGQCCSFVCPRTCDIRRGVYCDSATGREAEVGAIRTSNDGRVVRIGADTAAGSREGRSQGDAITQLKCMAKCHHCGTIACIEAAVTHS